MRLVESRLQGLEERIQQEQKSLRAEQAKRAEELKALVVEVKDSLRNLEKRHAKLEESAGLADAELRDQVLQHSSAISGEMAQLSSRLSSELARSVTELADDKVDTTVLAELLAGLSASLSGEGRRATKKASRS